MSGALWRCPRSFGFKAVRALWASKRYLAKKAERKAKRAAKKAAKAQKAQ